MTHTLLTISPRVEPYRCPPRPPPRAIAQRFSASAQSRRAARLSECPLSGEQATCSGIAVTSALDPLGHQQPPRIFLLSSRDVFKLSRLGRYNCRILIVGVRMQRREFSPDRAGG